MINLAWALHCFSNICIVFLSFFSQNLFFFSASHGAQTLVALSLLLSRNERESTLDMLLTVANHANFEKYL